jgi:hypothetical protein
MFPRLVSFRQQSRGKRHAEGLSLFHRHTVAIFKSKEALDLLTTKPWAVALPRDEGKAALRIINLP